MSKLVENLVSKSGLNLENIQELAQQVPQLSQALNMVGNPKDIVDNITNTITNNVTDKATSALGERGIIAGQVLEAPIPLSMSYKSKIDSIMMFRNVSIILIILWTFLLIVNKFTDFLSEETKEKIEFLNDKLIGNNGVISLIIFIWLFTVVIITLLPIFAQLEGVIPKLLSVLSVFVGGGN